MSELTLTAIRLGFLALLWLFVLTAVSVMRSDLFGTKVTTRPRTSTRMGRPGRSRPPKAGKPGPPKAGRPGLPVRPRRGAARNLVITEGPLAGTSVRLGDEPVTIGRAPDCTLVLADDFTSARHARLFSRDGSWFVEDLGSTNGTYLERTKVIGQVAVPVGTPIRIGKTVVELRK